MSDRITYHDAYGIGWLRLRELDGCAQLRVHNETDEIAVHLTPDALGRLSRDAAAMDKRLRKLSIPIYDLPFWKDPTTRPPTKRCASCKARILWVLNPAAKAMPLDADPVEDGGWLIEGKDDDGRWRGRPVCPLLDAHDGRERYVSHFATCEYANEHRKRRERGRTDGGAGSR